MKRVSVHLKPFLSLFLIISTLFIVAFTKMEVRRMGYVVLKESRNYKALKDQKFQKKMKLAHLLRSEHIRHYAVSRLTLSEARNGQIIQLVGQRIVVPQ
ncbi:MAG: histidine kinase [Bdellovibrionales bacterium]|nr:histidine kinase [Bdellovibrionales bacterium]